MLYHDLMLSASVLERFYTSSHLLFFSQGFLLFICNKSIIVFIKDVLFLFIESFSMEVLIKLMVGSYRGEIQI